MEKSENIDFIIDEYAKMSPEIKKLELGCRLRDKKGIIFYVMDRLGDSELLVITEGEQGMDMFGFGQDLQDRCKNIGKPLHLENILMFYSEPEDCLNIVSKWKAAGGTLEDQNSELIEKIANHLRK